MTPEGKARLKNLLICAWIGMLFGICAAVVSDARWPVILSVVLLVSGSSYLGVGRRWLEVLAPLVLIVALLGMVDFLPSSQSFVDFAHHSLAWTRASVQQ